MSSFGSLGKHNDHFRYIGRYSERAATTYSHEPPEHTSRLSQRGIARMASISRRLALLAIVSCLCYVAFAQRAGEKQEGINVGLLSTQELEEQLQVY